MSGFSADIADAEQADRDELDEARAEIAHLRAALKPFADLARRLVDARASIEASNWGGEDLLNDAENAIRALEGP